MWNINLKKLAGVKELISALEKYHFIAETIHKDIIKDGKLREFIDSDGTEFRVYFSYITKPYFEFKIVKCTF